VKAIIYASNVIRLIYTDPKKRNPIYVLNNCI